MGESPSTLAPLEELFVWYRKYGYSCGVTEESANCIGEYRSSNGYVRLSNLDPHQKRVMRDFLCGVGFIISGVFCITVNAPLGSRFGVPMISTGGKYLYDSITSMIEPS